MKYYDKNFRHFFKHKPTQITPCKGRILIAEPLLQGTHFSRSVILLTQHNNDGSMGLVLNKPLQSKVNEIVDIFPTCKSPLHLGGPVDTDHLFYIHTLGNLIPHSRPLGANLFFGGDFTAIKELLSNQTITPEQIRFFTGYAGWGKGQLEDEIEEKSWLVSLLDTPILMNADNLWETAVQDLGQPYLHWLNFPEKPEWN